MKKWGGWFVLKKNAKRIPNFNLIRTFVAITIAIVTAVIIIMLVSKEPATAIYNFLICPMTTVRYFGNVVELMTPLLFTGLAVSLMFQTKIYNLSTEGMFYTGGFVAAIFATLIPMTSGFHSIAGIVAGMLAASVIAFIPAFMKLKFGASEVVSSLMLNYIVFYIGDFILKTFMKDPKVTHVTSFKFLKTALLPRIIGKVHIGFIIAIILLFAVYLFLYHTKWGYAIRMTGENSNFSKYTGINTTKAILMSQVMGGAIAGLGGAAHILGSQQRFNWEWRPGYGWDGIIIAIIAQYNPKYIPMGAFILAYLRIGSDIMSRTTDVPNEVVALIQGIMIVLIAASGFLESYRKKLVVKHATENLITEGGGIKKMKVLTVITSISFFYSL